VTSPKQPRRQCGGGKRARENASLRGRQFSFFLFLAFRRQLGNSDRAAAAAVGVLLLRINQRARARAGAAKGKTKDTGHHFIAQEGFVSRETFSVKCHRRVSSFSSVTNWCF